MSTAAKELSYTGLDLFYERLFSTGFFVFDSKEPYFQEKVLQVIWNEQILTDSMTTEDGRRLQVIHPGIWNVEAGPDFHDAVIAIDGELKRGSVEIHLRPENWDQHGHNTDPKYSNTILHVVWDNPCQHERYPLNTPLCCLAERLSIPLDQILKRSDWAVYPYARKVQPAACADQIATLDDAYLADILQSYGVSRVLEKARKLSEQIQGHGLEETVYRALFDVMGYKTNRKPFRDLADAVPLRDLTECDDKAALAILFGAAGFLPDPSREEVPEVYRQLVLELWGEWWSRRRGLETIQWSRGRMRPFNAPERRLLAAHLILRKNRYQLGKGMIRAFLESNSARDCVKLLIELLDLEEFHAWNGFLNFRTQLSKPGNLLGDSRAYDLIVNLAIPLFFSWCFLNNRPEECAKGKEVLASVPKLQNNRVFKEAVHQFFVPPSRAAGVVRNACAQQGLISMQQELFLNI